MTTTTRFDSDTLERLAAAGLVPERLPRHVAVIMDGNGRWAKKRGLPRIEGHRRGVKTVRTTIEGCCALGIGQLTLSIPSSRTPRRMNGATAAGKSMPPASPHAATAPP